jgi:SAM-dependent methyltransferase
MDLRERRRGEHARHPWEVARSRFFLEVLARQGAYDRAADWLDVGAGDAWLGGELQRRLPEGSTVVGWDINYDAEDLASRSLPPGMRLTAQRPLGPFGGVLLLDVMEHVREDREFVAGIVDELVEPGGWVLVSVPAHPLLFSDHDRFLHHFRRYRPSQCRAVLEGAGVEILACGGVFHTLLAVRALQVAMGRLLPRGRPAGGVGGWTAGPTITAVVTGVLDLDTRVSLRAAERGRQLPALSYWVLGRRAR